ncbi:MAG TPA: NAD-dependent epimerase/dehydratase family protein [Nannocystis sp.]
MQVAVTGASGFIGQATVAALVQAGHAVVGLSRGRRARPAIAGVTWRTVDATREGPELAAALAGCEAVINLVGIKRSEDDQDFARAHVATIAALAGAMKAAGVQRLVHISVAGPGADPPAGHEGPYLATKREGEQAVMSSGLAFTILRPGPVAGPGDDFVRNLAATIRHASVFPAPVGGRAILQPVLVEDVARAIVAALERPAAIGQTYDVVGPERLTLAEIVVRTATALGLPVRLLPCPMWLLAPAVTVLERLPDPLLTRAQLGLLSWGVVGDPGPARHDLGIEPQRLTEARIAALAKDVPPWLGISLRLRRGDEDMFFGTCSKGARNVWWIVPLAIAVIAILGAVTTSVWTQMAAANAILAPLCLLAVPLPWRTLWRPSLRVFAQGVLAAAVLLAAGWLFSQVMFALWPAGRAEAAEIYDWGRLLAPWQGALLLPAIAAGEEVIWRGAVAFGVAARAGPWWGCLVAGLMFALAHASLGQPLLVAAAAGAGLFWAWLGLKTRSLLTVLVCHVLWDAAVVLLRLY